jgi:hypothetical protein
LTMASFLVTPAMPPALATRVMASVKGKQRRGAPKVHGPRISMAALIPVTAVVVVVGLMLFSRWMANRELELARADVLQKLATQQAWMPAGAASFLPMVQTWVTRTAGNYEGDLITDDLRIEGALQARLARPSLFLRGSQPKLARPDQLVEAAAGSVKDAFVLCLSEPPDSRAEKSVMHKIKGANFAGALPQMRRYFDAEAGLALLQPAWEAKVRAASEPKALHSMSAEWMRAPLEDGRQAAAAELLLVVVDELPVVEPDADPGDGRRPEERPHAMRMAVVDLRAQNVLLRLRKTEDPSAFAPVARLAHAQGITGCLFAMDVRDAVKGP